MSTHLLDSLFEPVAIVNSDLEITYYNHMFSTFTKSPPRVIKSKKYISEIIKEDFLKDLINISFKTKSNGISKEEKITLDQLHDFYVIVRCIYNEEDNTTMISLNDISIERNLYIKYRYQIDELKSIHHQIIQADKLSTIGEITASISHEVSNPLTIASGTLELIKALIDSEDINPQREMLNNCLTDVFESFSRIDSIIKGMKKFLHGNEDKKEYVPLEEVIDNSKRLVSSQLKKYNIELIKDFDDEQKSIVFVNALKMEQVFINLIKNSIDSISSNFDDTTTPNGKITLSIKETSVCYNISISDTGRGVPESSRSKIFDSFFTTKELGEGTGLGLAIASKILESYNATIELTDSKETTFMISIPKMSTINLATSTLSSDNAIGSYQNILVIDDETKVLNIINEFLTNDGHHVICASSANEALELIKDCTFDLIFLDYEMPISNGDKLALAFRDEGLMCPIIFISDKISESELSSSISKSIVNDRLKKPFSSDDLKTMVEKWIKEE